MPWVIAERSEVITFGDLKVGEHFGLSGPYPDPEGWHWSKISETSHGRGFRTIREFGAIQETLVPQLLKISGSVLAPSYRCRRVILKWEN